MNSVVIHQEDIVVLPGKEKKEPVVVEVEEAIVEEPTFELEEEKEDPFAIDDEVDPFDTIVAEDIFAEEDFDLGIQTEEVKQSTAKRI